MGWMDNQRLAADAETTAPDPTEAHLVTFCLMRVEPDGTPWSRNWLADPGIEIPAEAAEVHGVSTEHAREHGIPEADAVAQILAELEAGWNPDVPLVIYNAPYDLTLLDHRARRLGVGELKIRGPVLDPLALDRIVNRYRKGKRKLIMNCERYGVKLSEADAHSADADCRAAHDLAWAMARRHPEIRNATLRDLYVVQRRGHREWAANFQEWLRAAPRRDEETEEQAAERANVVIEGDWPLRPYTSQDIELSPTGG